MEKSGGWRWTLSIFHHVLISLLEWNTKIPVFPRRKIPWNFRVCPFSSRFSEHWRRKESRINQHCFFSPRLSVFLWDRYLIKISVLSQTCSVVSTPETFCWQSLFIKSTLGTWEYWVKRWQTATRQKEVPSSPRSSREWESAVVQLQHSWHSPDFCQTWPAVSVQGRLQRLLLHRLFQNSFSPSGMQQCPRQGRQRELSWALCLDGSRNAKNNLLVWCCAVNVRLCGQLPGLSGSLRRDFPTYSALWFENLPTHW